MATSGLVKPTKVKLSDIKSKLLRPALTSHFQCQFNPPADVRDYIGTNKGYNFNSELISLACCDASLPGSSLQTNEINDDYTGVTERLAYRRQYDDRADFTFYVDHGNLTGDYNVIWFFEQWIAHIANEQTSKIANGSDGIESRNYYYRFKFPDGPGTDAGQGYRSPALYLTKFERDFQGSCLTYRFLNAYPISVNSMPVSYESSELLKCTVSFTYTRYVVNRDLLPEIPDDKLGPVGSTPKTGLNLNEVAKYSNTPPIPTGLSDLPVPEQITYYSKGIQDFPNFLLP